MKKRIEVGPPSAFGIMPKGDEFRKGKLGGGITAVPPSPQNHWISKQSGVLVEGVWGFEKTSSNVWNPLNKKIPPTQGNGLGGGEPGGCVVCF